MSLCDWKTFNTQLAAIAVCGLIGCLILIFDLTTSPVQALEGPSSDLVVIEADSVNGHENLPPGVSETVGEEELTSLTDTESVDDEDGPVVHLPAIIFIIAAIITAAAFLFFIRKFVSRRP